MDTFFSQCRKPGWTLIGLMVALLLIWGGWRLESHEANLNRGITYGSPPPIEHLPSPWGVNVALEQYDDPSLAQALEGIAAGGFHWVRQTFPWAQIEPAPGQFHWERWDRIVSAVNAQGLELIAVLDTTPAWARDGGNLYSPPRKEADFGRFAHAFAARYGDRVHYYQIWDEPNLSSHWGGYYVDPEAYARLLWAGASQIRAADHQAIILTAGLAPTWEQGPLNLDEAAFLEGLYRAGAEGSFDIVAAKPYGFWSGPEDRRVSPYVLNFSRLIRLREVMVAHGDGDKPIWAVEWGWNALPPHWQGHPSPWGTDREEKQIRRVRAAVERARLEWPWLGAMVWAEYQPAAPPDDPRWGFALLDQEGHPRSFYYALQEKATAPAVAYPGRYPANHPTGHYEGDWRIVAGRADIGRSGDSLTIPFRGTGLGLVVRRGDYWAWLEVTVDGAPANALPRDGEGRAYAILYDPLERETTIPLARGLKDGFHEARIMAHGGWGQWAIRGWIVSREGSRWPGRVGRALCAAGLVLLGWAAWCARGSIPTRWATLHSRQLALPFAALSVAWLSLPLGRGGTIASTAALSLLAAWQPLWILGGLLFALPFYKSSHPLPGLPVAPLDLLGIAAAVGVGVQVTSYKLQVAGRLDRSTLPAPRLSLQGLGWTFAALMGLGLASTLAAEEKLLAWGDFWRVIALPGLVYLLVCRLPQGREDLWDLIHVLVASGVAAAGMGLYQLAVGQTIPAEGVRRITGPYSSPNHLALFLERLVPLLVAIALGSRSGRRRWGYGLSLLPILAALYLTYSRAAWLLALPASLLFLGLAIGDPWRRWAWVGALSALGVMIPWRGTERLASLFDLGSGTGALRLQVWRATLEMIATHPLLGIGPGNFPFAYPRYMRPTAWIEPLLYHSHNVFLDFAAFLGLGGLVLFIGLLVAFFRTGWRLLHVLPSSRERALLAGLMAAIVGSLAHGLVDHGYFLPDLACLWALILGVIDWLERAPTE